MFNKISHAAGFTSTEMKSLSFLMFIFLTGLTYKYFFLNDLPPLQKFDYSVQDSIFNAAALKSTGTEDAGVSNNVVDYKQEVLDFNKQNFKGKKRIDLLKEKSINLNKAQLDDLTMLPGIGEATAKNILLYRDARGGFKTLDELMNVKRIGEKRFNQIKRFIFIE